MGNLIYYEKLDDYETQVKKAKENEKYKSVLDEIREYIKEYIREDAEYSNYMEMEKENYNELLQILDKVKE